MRQRILSKSYSEFLLNCQALVQNPFSTPETPLPPSPKDARTDTKISWATTWTLVQHYKSQHPGSRIDKFSPKCPNAGVPCRQGHG